MKLAGKPSPDSKCHAHALIAGNDPAASALRALLALAGRRVDDHVNGVWLPGYESYLPHWAMPNAVAHAWLNHAGYHRWLATDIFLSLIGGPDPLAEGIDLVYQRKFVAKLKSTATLLQNHRRRIPPYALQSKADTIRRKQARK